jgi:hypothetical protein
MSLRGQRVLVIDNYDEKNRKRMLEYIYIAVGAGLLALASAKHES